MELKDGRASKGPNVFFDDLFILIIHEYYSLNVSSKSTRVYLYECI